VAREDMLVIDFVLGLLFLRGKSITCFQALLFARQTIFQDSELLPAGVTEAGSPTLTGAQQG
jgi:hypothetical protein